MDLAKFFLSGDSLKLGRLFLGFALAITVQSVALDYSDMEAIFRSSQTPKAEKLVGTWVGRCVHQVDPLRLWPAFFQFRNRGADLPDTVDVDEDKNDQKDNKEEPSENSA
ncbi:hypothetical protein EBT16_08685 [bacterium]|nr:hypothetical protein [bacterium]